MHIGKVKPIKTSEKFPHFQKSLRELGQNWGLDERTMVDLEHFVCALYERARYHDVNKLRYDMFMGKCQLLSLDASKGEILVFFHPVEKL